MIALIQMNMVVMNLMILASLKEPSTFWHELVQVDGDMGVFFLTKPQSRQLIEAPLSMRALVMTSLLTVFLSTDRVMQNDFDFLSAVITLLIVLGDLCIRGELPFKNPVHRV